MPRAGRTANRTRLTLLNRVRDPTDSSVFIPPQMKPAWFRLCGRSATELVFAFHLYLLIVI